jgi:hypothetical protein
MAGVTQVISRLFKRPSLEHTIILSPQGLLKGTLRCVSAEEIMVLRWIRAQGPLRETLRGRKKQIDRLLTTINDLGKELSEVEIA